jgi:hypothetical protein
MKRSLQYAALGIPALLFLREVFLHLQNIPTMDDYDIILDFVNKYIVASPMDKMTMIVSQYSEHRLIPSKLLYVGYYYLTGAENFRVIGILGDLQLIPVGLIGVYFIRKAHEAWYWPAAVWMLLVFDLNTYENACMTMNAVGNYGVICYFFCALYFYERKKYVPAILFQALCIGSNGNGCMAAMLLLLAYSLHWLDKSKTAEDRKRWWICAVTNLILLPCYFIPYHSVTLPNPLPFSLTHDLTYLIQMTGAPFSFNPSLYYGLLVTALAIFLFPWKRILNPTLRPSMVIFTFAAGTMVLAAIFRAGYPDAQFQTSRYLLYPQMMIGILGFYAWRRLYTASKLRWTRFLVPALAFLVYAGNYSFGEIGFKRTEFRATTRRFWHPHPERCVLICKESCYNDIYCIDDYRTPQMQLPPRYYILPRSRPAPGPFPQLRH